MKRSALTLAAGLLAAFVAASALAGSKDPIEGERFQRVMQDQQVDFQAFLRGYMPDSLGYQVTGPLVPYPHDFDDAVERPAANSARSVRVICRDMEAYERAVDVLPSIPGFQDMPQSDDRMHWYPGRVRGDWFSVRWGLDGYGVLITTYQQHRWLIWRRDVDLVNEGRYAKSAIDSFADAVSGFLWELEHDAETAQDVQPPRASEYGLPAEFDLYPPRPDYVIQGYQNYKDHLHDYADIETWFADGILAFVPDDSLIVVLKDKAPRTAWPNKEAPLLQYEFRKYFERGGLLIEITELTKSTLAQLEPGEYFYAVGLNGRIRFAFETPREEVERIEKETGRKVPRANHAFLFPGEPVLTAGAFFVALDPDPRIVEVNTHSGHYFYSNVTATIREDIALRSDHYLLTVGHFLTALDREQIPYNGILISKM